MYQTQMSKTGWRRPRLIHAAGTLFLYMGAWGFTLNLFPQVLLQRCNNDYSLAAKYNGYFTAVNSLATFFTNPTCGVLSDKFGRKPFFFSSMVSN